MKVKAKSEFSTIRIRKGLSITALANAMQVSPSLVFRIEQGKNLTPATAKKACDALGEDFDDLFTID